MPTRRSHSKLAWAITGLLFFLAFLAYWAQGRYLIGRNLTSSLTGSVFLVDLRYDPANLALGDLVAFRFSAEHLSFPADAVWAKRVAGLPGEDIKRRDDSVLVGDRLVARLQVKAMAQANVRPTTALEVPAKHFFVIGDHARSLDSRYDEFGFVAFSHVLGKAWTLW